MYVLLAMAINTPFPTLFLISIAAVVLLAIELFIANKISSSIGKYIYWFSITMVIGILLAGWSGYYYFSGPSFAEPINHLTGTPTPYYELYKVGLYLTDFVFAPLFFIIIFGTAFWLIKHHQTS